MWAYIDAVIRLQHGWAHVVDEHERTDAARLQVGTARRTSSPPMSWTRGTIRVTMRGLAVAGKLSFA